MAKDLPNDTTPTTAPSVTSLFGVSGRRAIVTGGDSGLGHGQAEALLEAGAQVVIMARTRSKVDAALAGWARRGLEGYGVVADLSDAASRGRGFDEAVATLGGLDVLVNTAGMITRHRAEDYPLDEYRAVLAVNAEAPFGLSQRAARIFIAQGHGKIINMASMLSFSGGANVPAYAASKGAIAQLTKACANEWAAHGINVNAIAPGYMATDLNTSLQGEDNPRYREITARIPAGRWGNADDLKGITVFLASGASDYLNGAVIPVDGGYLGR
ncbi:SDR family oxidoreductase [Propionibacterium freudenreichii]|uniref:SDR family oxidoreductase n=1 Tax=Propionibacterium freudenreichii TaxID=1744 RepID=UPI0038525D52